jgi:mono/diheme cytochrome c family protein
MTIRWMHAAGVGVATLLVAAIGVQTTIARAQDQSGEPCAPQRLVDTGLYAAGRPGVVDASNRPYAPQYPLWSDGATKKRWVHLPAGATIDVTKSDAWDFPVGTRFWKEFSFHGRKVETRLLWKASADRWVTASYVWNDDGTDAVLAPDQGIRGVIEIAPGRQHSIPATADCAACHGSDRVRPLGFTALQLSSDRDPNALHKEPLEPDMLTLSTLMSERLLTPGRPDYVDRPPRIAAAREDTRAVLGYLSANCGSCHNGAGTITAPAPVLRERDLLNDGDAVARDWIGHATRWQLPGATDGTVLINPDAPENSALLARMRSRRPSSQMPPLGTVVRDDQALEAIARWIASDAPRSR